jgi:RNA polymerase sigma-70 factor (ECF subfamily)
MGFERIGTARKDILTLFGAGTVAGLTDGQLLERFAARGSEASELAFSALVARHGPMVLRACLGIIGDEHEAQDAFQASFLILARKARTLWVRDSLGPWLHRVACRTAVRASLHRDRRRATERRIAGELRRLEAGPATDDRGRVIHEEVDRLPDRYRIPVVLCDLEGRTYEEAARHLGCPIGTVKSRLARGRERLRERLTRRGLSPSGGLMGIGPFRVPALLADDTTRLIVRVAMGRPVPASISVLMKGGWKTMAKIQMAIGVGVVLGAIGIGWASSSPTARPPAVTIRDEPRGDVERIEGAWVRVSTDGVKPNQTIIMFVRKDTDRPEEEIPPGAAAFVFEWKSAGDAGGSSNRVLLDPTKEPKTLDFFPGQEGAPKVCPGIYQLEGDLLTVCFLAVSGDRPSEFAGGKPGETLDVYRRVKP